MATIIVPRQAFVPVYLDDKYCAMPEHPVGRDQIYHSMIPVRCQRPVLSLSSHPLRHYHDLRRRRRERILNRLVPDLLSAASHPDGSIPCSPADIAGFLLQLSGSRDVAKSTKDPGSDDKSSSTENGCPKTTIESPTLDKTQGGEQTTSASSDTSNSPFNEGHEEHDSASSGGCLTSSLSAIKPDETANDHDDRFDLSLQIGDFPPENVQVNVTDRKLTVRAHCDKRDEKSGWMQHKLFEYSFHLPDNASLDSLTSSYDTKGVLSITASKTDNPTRQVPVQIRDVLESVKSTQDEEHEVEQTTSGVNDSIDTSPTETEGRDSCESAEKTVGDDAGMEEEEQQTED